MCFLLFPLLRWWQIGFSPFSLFFDGALSSFSSSISGSHFGLRAILSFRPRFHFLSTPPIFLEETPLSTSGCIDKSLSSPRPHQVLLAWDSPIYCKENFRLEKVSQVSVKGSKGCYHGAVLVESHTRCFLQYVFFLLFCFPPSSVWPSNVTTLAPPFPLSPPRPLGGGAMS